MSNPTTCCKCNFYIGNIYFVNGKINASYNNVTNKKNKIYYIADENTQYSYPYCQKCWISNALATNALKQQIDPIIDANYTLYLNEHVDNINSKKELSKMHNKTVSMNNEIIGLNTTIKNINDNFDANVSEQVERLNNDLKNRLDTEIENNNILVNKYITEIDALYTTIETLNQKNDNAKHNIENLYIKIDKLEQDLYNEKQENVYNLSCLSLVTGDYTREKEINLKAVENIENMKKQINDCNDVTKHYENLIKSLETRITSLRSIILSNDRINTSLKNTYETNKKLMKNMEDANKAKVVKMQYYLNDLNDYIENNFNVNMELDQMVINYLRRKNKLLKRENKQLKAELEPSNEFEYFIDGDIYEVDEVHELNEVNEVNEVENVTDEKVEYVFDEMNDEKYAGEYDNEWVSHEEHENIVDEDFIDENESDEFPMLKDHDTKIFYNPLYNKIIPKYTIIDNYF